MSSATTSLTRSAVAAPNFMLREHAATLRSHLRQCSQARGWWFVMAALGDQIHALVAPRLISTVTAAFVLFGVIVLWA